MLETLIGAVIIVWIIRVHTKAAASGLNAVSGWLDRANEEKMRRYQEAGPQPSFLETTVSGWKAAYPATRAFILFLCTVVVIGLFASYIAGFLARS